MKRLVLAACMVIAGVSTVSAAQSDDYEFSTMLNRAKRDGMVPVTVGLVRVKIDELSKDVAGFNELSQLNAQSVLKELGSETVAGGSTAPQLGHIDVWVTPKGLEILKASKTAISMTYGPNWNERILIPNIDGSLSAIENLLKTDGYAEIEATLDVEGVEFDVDARSGRSSLLINSDAQKTSARAAAQRLSTGLGISLNSLSTSRSKNLTILKSDSLEAKGTIILKANRIGLFELARLDSVRAIKPVSYVDKRPVTIDADAVKIADKMNEVDVLVQLSTPYIGGNLAPATFEAQAKSNERMLKELLAPYKMLREPNYLGLFGTVGVRLSKSDFEKLAKSGDQRLAGILAVKPHFKSSLATATATMNLPGYWAIGYTGAGQTIVIMDSGVKKSHQMLSGKVIGEGCFQSNLYNTWNGHTYQSDCPVQNGNGDSVFPSAGSGEPLSASDCISAIGTSSDDLMNRLCGHGTHVASIAAGGYSSSLGGTYGVANGASIVSINVNSRDAAAGGGLWVLNEDMMSATAALAKEASRTPGIIGYTVNMSFGSESWYETGPSGLRGDSSNIFGGAVSTLYGKGIPVVAAMGNFRQADRIHEPASVPGVVKVGATRNFLNSHDVSDMGNRADPAGWPGEYFFMAPGGEQEGLHESKVTAAKAYNGTTTDTFSMPGTSMSTPIVSGMYSLIKSAFPGYGVAPVSNFIATNMSDPTNPKVSGSPSTGFNMVTFRQVRMNP